MSNHTRKKHRSDSVGRLSFVRRICSGNAALGSLNRGAEPGRPSFRTSSSVGSLHGGRRPGVVFLAGILVSPGRERGTVFFGDAGGALKVGALHQPLLAPAAVTAVARFRRLVRVEAETGGIAQRFAHGVLPVVVLAERGAVFYWHAGTVIGPGPDVSPQARAP